jgi:hypothetical protein
MFSCWQRLKARILPRCHKSCIALRVVRCSTLEARLRVFWDEEGAMHFTQPVDLVEIGQELYLEKVNEAYNFE